MSVAGPAVFQVPVVYPASRGAVTDQWVLNDSRNHGVKVVETPLKTSLIDGVSPARQGYVTVAVNPGA